MTSDKEGFTKHIPKESDMSGVLCVKCGFKMEKCIK